jgi:thiamine transport system permease protein
MATGGRASGRTRAWAPAGQKLLFVLPILFLLGFFFYPLANILRLGVTAEAVRELAGGRPYLGIVWFTFWQATLSTILTIVLGLPAAYLFARFDFRGRDLLRALVTVPFVLPTVVVAAAFRTLFGAQGPINEWLVALLGLERAPLRLEQTLAIILLAHVYYNVAVVIRLVGGFWSNLSPRMGEAARVLGASPRRGFWEVTLPLLRPPLVSAALLIYLFSFTSFGVILILGGPAFSTIETEIYRQYVTFLRPDIAAALSMVQIAFTYLLISLYTRWQGRASLPLELRPGRSNRRPAGSAAERALLVALVGGLSLFMFAPLLALVWRSLHGPSGEFTVSYYQALPVARRGAATFIPPLLAIRNSLAYALLTLLSAGGLGLIAATLLTRAGRRRTWLEPLMMLPLGASAVTLGFGFVVTYDRLRTSPLLVLIAHTLVAMPFVVRSIVPVMQGIRPALRESAALLGASPWQVWRQVDLPIVGRALLVGAVFAFTISIGEFGATSFIVRPNSGYLTLPIAIQRYLGLPGALNFGQALAMSTILMAVCVVGFLAIERFRLGEIGEF